MTEGELLLPYVLRSMDRLIGLLAELPDETARRWRPEAAGANSVATLVTHMLGNFERNVLGIVGGEPVKRDRLAEFATEPLSLDAARRRWERLQVEARRQTAAISPESWLGPVDHDHRGRITRLEILFVVARHAAEHVGQAELTRDLWKHQQQG